MVRVRSLFIKAILLTIVLMLQRSPSVAQEEFAGEPSDWARARTLSFPKDRSLGSIWIRDVSEMSREEIEQLSFSSIGDELWFELGSAQGELEIPEHHLAWLKVSGSGAADLSPLKELPRNGLQVLTSFVDHVEGRELEFIGMQFGLLGLNLRSVHATDEHSHHLKELNQLVSLVWSNFGFQTEDDRGITDESADLFRCFPKLRTLALRRQPIGDKCCQAIAELKELKILTLNSSDITDAGVAHLSLNDSIESLGLGEAQFGCELTDEGMKSIGKMDQLTWLVLSGNPITGEGLKELKRLESLESLSMDGTSVTDKELGYLQPLASLKDLRFYPGNGRRLGDEAAIQLSTLSNLERLTTRWQLTDVGYAHLANLQKLQSLAVKGDLEESTIEAICRMEGLETLSFQGRDSIKGTHLAELSKLRNLSTLSFSSRGIAPDAFIHLGKLKKLTGLNVMILGENSVLLLEDRNLEALSNLKDLRSLSLSPFEVDERFAKVISSFPAMKNLEIDQSGRPIDDRFIKEISTLEHIENLALRPGVVTDDGIDHLLGFRKMYSLSIDSLATNDGLMKLSALPNLRYLNGETPFASEEINDLIRAKFPAVEHANIRISAPANALSYNRDGFLQRLAGDLREPYDLMQGKPAPILETQFHENVPSMLNLAHFRGKPLVVCFFDKWIALSYPNLDRMKLIKEKYGDEFEFLAIHNEADQETLKAEIAKNKITWPTVADVEGNSVEHWNATGADSFYVIDQEGMVKYALIHPAEIDRVLESMIGKQN